MSELDFFQMTVSAFPGHPRRAALYGLFAGWASRLRNLGIGGSLWLDGSFLTSKTDPDDIDLVLWSPTQGKPLKLTEQKEVVDLLDHGASKILYRLDLYVEMTTVLTDAKRKAYWMSVFGRCHDGVTPKGIAEVAL
ncbi:MAG: hypothetical protein V4864_16065 [Pseudomonadota bacterium]